MQPRTKCGTGGRFSAEAREITSVFCFVFSSSSPPPADQIERRLDTVRSVCHIAQKRLIACFQGQHGTDPDKRHVSTIALWLVF